MAGRRRNTPDHSAGAGPQAAPAESLLPADYDLAELYGAGGRDEDDEDLDDTAVLVPPIALPPEAELAAAALAVPLIARAVALARWAAPHRVVDEFGDLVEDDRGPAARLIGLAPEEGEVPEEAVIEVLRAWSLACDLDLVELGTTQAGEHVAVPMEEVADAEAGDPSTVLDLWLTAAGIVRELAVDTDLLDIEGEGPGEGAGAGAAGDADDEDAAESALAEVEEASEAAAELLDEALQVLYELTAFAEPGEETVPLGVLAALLVVPEGEEPDEEMLGQITDLMVELDPMLADLAELGLVEHRPIDPELFEEEEEGEEAAPAAEAAGEPSEEDAARFGLVRLTPLGQYGVREWLLADGYDAPLIGDLAQGDAAALLRGLAESPNVLPDREIQVWLAGREPLDGARDLLAASRGLDAHSPVRRMFTAAALDDLGEAGDTALTEVVDDPELGGLARELLRSHGHDVAAAERPVALWRTVDHFSAVLLVGRGEAGQLRELVAGLPVTDNPASYFGELWRVPHPYTALVLDTVGELHTDRAVAKEARKAAFKAKSQQGNG
ncbi:MULTISPECIES: hypothetical protein [Kitasatospora]|uniref:Uncharacterized protein n=1 Tax=Kitasatospora arboriphila TaxID=258052 RepID=A0ABN1TA90_9ACTN